MALMPVPIFLPSLACTLPGLSQGIRQRRAFLSVSSGLLAMGLSFPVCMMVLDGMSEGFVQEHRSLRWHLVRRSTIADGCIYMDAGGLLLVIVSLHLFVLQLWRLFGKGVKQAFLPFRRINIE